MAGQYTLKKDVNQYGNILGTLKRITQYQRANGEVWELENRPGQRRWGSEQQPLLREVQKDLPRRGLAAKRPQ